MKPMRGWRTGLWSALIAGTVLAVGWTLLADGSATSQAVARSKPGSKPALSKGMPGASAYAAGAAAPTSPAPVPEAAASSAGRDHRAALAALDTGLVSRRIATDGPSLDAFATKSWFVAPPPSPPAPPPPPPPAPPPPQAPPLPFKYMGMLEESADRTVWYLVQGERLIVAATGEVIDATYRIDGADKGQLRFTYLPLDQRQTLAIGGPP